MESGLRGSGPELWVEGQGRTPHGPVLFCGGREAAARGCELAVRAVRCANLCDVARHRRALVLWAPLEDYRHIMARMAQPRYVDLPRSQREPRTRHLVGERAAGAFATCRRLALLRRGSCVLADCSCRSDELHAGAVAGQSNAMLQAAVGQTGLQGCTGDAELVRSSSCSDKVRGSGSTKPTCTVLACSCDQLEDPASL